MRPSRLGSFPTTLALKSSQIFWFYTPHRHTLPRMQTRSALKHRRLWAASDRSDVNQEHR
jgi:hypothetical protein